MLQQLALPTALPPRLDCYAIARMPLSQMLYHILAGELHAGGDYLPV